MRLPRPIARSPRLAVLVILVASAAQAQTTYQQYVDHAARFSLMLPDGATPSTSRPGAAGEWTLPGAVSLWVEVLELAPTEELSAYEQAVTSTVQGQLDKGWSLAGSSRLDEVALQGHAVEQGVGVRLHHPGSSEAAVVVVLAKGSVVYVLWVAMPADAARDARLGGILSEVVSSFRVRDGVTPAEGTGSPSPDVAPSMGTSAVGVLTSAVVDDPSILVGRTAVFAHSFAGESVDGWYWELGDGVAAPAPTPGAGLSFSSQGGRLFAAERPAPLLTRPPLAPPFEVVVEMSKAAAEDASGTVQLVLYDDPTRSVVVTVARGEDHWLVEGMLRRHSREDRHRARVPGSTLWARAMCDGDRVSLFVSGDGAHWLPAHAGDAPRPFRLTSPRFGIAMPDPAQACARVERVSVVAMAEMPHAPSVEGQAFAPRGVEGSSDGGPLMVSGVFRQPEDGPISEVELLVSVGDKQIPVRFVRDAAGPLNLAQGSDPAVVCHSVVPQADGGLAVLVGLDAALVDPEAEVTVLGAAFAASGLGSGTWRLVPGDAQALDASL